MRFSVGALCLLAFAGCSGSGSGSLTSTSVVGAAFSSVNSSIGNVDGLMPNNVSLTAVEASDSVSILTGVTTPNDIWNGQWMSEPRCSGGMSDPHCGTGNVSLKFWTSFMLDVNARRDNGSDISIFGRIRSSLSQVCAVSSLLSSADGTLPAAGTYTITFSAANVAMLKTYCGFTDSDLAGMTGMSANAVVTNTTDTTYYDRKIVLTFGGDSQSFFVRVNASSVNVGSAETGSDNFSRSFVSLNRATNSVRAEYISRKGASTSGAGEWGRLFYDGATNDAAIAGATYDFGVSPNRLIYTMRGTPGVSGSQVAYSVGAVGFGLTTVWTGASTTNLNHAKACLNLNNGVVATDNTVSCSGGIVGGDTSSTFGTNFASLITAITPNGSKLTDASVYSETGTVPFTTAATMFTTPVAIGP